MTTKTKQEAQNPLILRSHRLMEAFAKSDDERDFYLDRLEGFIVYADLDKPENELLQLEEEVTSNSDRYCIIPKLTFYETKKIMEGFVNEKVYDIDTKEKLLDIIQSKEARHNFLEFIYDHHAELDKWQQYYQERSRIRIIEWLRNNHFTFVFEEDLDLAKSMIEKLKRSLFDSKVGKDILTARKILFAKSKTYYSSEALNPRPKRGRPPKQAAKLEIEPQITTDIYTTVPNAVRPFLFTPDISSLSAFTFSAKFGTEADLLQSRKLNGHQTPPDISVESLNQKLAALRTLSSKWVETDTKPAPARTPLSAKGLDFDDEDEDEEEDLDTDEFNNRKLKKSPPAKAKIAVSEKSSVKIPKTKEIPKAKEMPKAKEKPIAKSVKESQPKPAKRPMQKIMGKSTSPASKKGPEKSSAQKKRPAKKIVPKSAKPTPKFKK